MIKNIHLPHFVMWVLCLDSPLSKCIYLVRFHFVLYMIGTQFVNSYSLFCKQEVMYVFQR